MEKTAEEKQKDAHETLHRLLKEYKTASLATVDGEGQPQASYTPVALDRPGGSFYLFVSELSAHTANLRTQQTASLLLMEDELSSKQLFARNRVTFGGSVEPIARDSEGWAEACLIYGAKFGKFFELLVSLPDFQMFRFRPEDIRLVVGFGAAYQVTGEDWSELTLMKV